MARTRRSTSAPAAAKDRPGQSPAESPGATAPDAPARRRVVITGGAGFIGGRVVAALLERGDEVVALVRDPRRVAHLAELGAELVESDLSDVADLARNLEAADALVHAAGSYRVGIRKSEHGAMWDANVGTTTRVLDAAEAAGTPRIVYVSTVGVYGNTRGAIVDETHRRDLAAGFLSWYDETKYGAHEVVEQRIRGGAPVVIVLPSQVYGPGDRSEVGGVLGRASLGRLRATALDEVGLGFVHVDDGARGIVAALDDGRAGESYILSGPTMRLADAIAIAAAVNGHRRPRIRIPTAVLRVVAPATALLGRQNLGELISAGAGVTHWASSARAERELGFRPRSVEQ
ncbi:MAG TPA: NAD-dependent epimerase/dehydratase family protein, partial [Candidatus Limnocylindrales bacterium]|nr:NAD-dependent epimerase/dehydratase family protein [Candidatus Limnocylindrales bacterium]